MHESEKWEWSRSVVSDSQWPHGLQPTRFLCPWDFPGKSTGVGCHCLLRSQVRQGNTASTLKGDPLALSQFIHQVMKTPRNHVERPGVTILANSPRWGPSLGILVFSLSSHMCQVSRWGTQAGLGEAEAETASWGKRRRQGQSTGGQGWRGRESLPSLWSASCGPGSIPHPTSPPRRI